MTSYTGAQPMTTTHAHGQLKTLQWNIQVVEKKNFIWQSAHWMLNQSSKADKISSVYLLLFFYLKLY
jgi:hypothetical protein